MKILLVTDLYPVKNENISKALFYFASEWLKQGCCVEVIRPNFIFNTLIRGRKIIKEEIYYEHGIKIYNINCFTPFWFNIRKKLPEDFSLSSYDIMISHMPSGALFSLRLMEKEKIKYICAVHASDITVLNDFKYSFYFKNKLETAYAKADKIAARSPVLKQKIEKIIPCAKNKTFTAYSGIDSSNIAPLRRGSLKNKVLKIYTASSFIKRKNIDIIINGLALLKNDFQYVLTGAGREYSSIKKAAAKPGILSKIQFTGSLPHYEVLKHMQNSDIFILLSRSETFGLVYLEAAAAGCIIIASKNDGIDGILKDGVNAFLIPPDRNSLACCIEKIISMPQSELDKIRANAVCTVQNLSKEKAAADYLLNAAN